MLGLGNDVPETGPEDDAAFFRAMVEALPAAIYATDAEGRITYYNEAAAQLWGRRPRLGEDWWCGSWRLYWPNGERMRHDECPMAEALKTGKAVRGVEAIAERPDGTRFPFVPYPTLLFDKVGTLTGAVNMLVDIGEANRGKSAAGHLAAIVESSDDAIVSKNLDGIIQSWNQGAERMFGYRPEEIIGKSVLTLIPPDRHHEEDTILARIRRGERIAHFETVRRAKDGSLLDVSLTVSPVKDESGRIVGASKIARDITQQRKAHQRLEILFRVAREMSKDLDMERIVQAATDLATEVSGARFGAFFYNVKDESGESYQLYTLSGAPRESFEKFGTPRNTDVFGPTFRGEAIVRSDDIRQDPRYGRNAPHSGMPEGHLPVVSYLAVPVISATGNVHGGLFFGHDRPGIFSAETEDLVAAIAAQTATAMDKAQLHKAMEEEIVQRREAQETQQLLVNEIKHRVKNTLGTVQAMAAQSFKGAPTADREAFSGRLMALSEAHDVLTLRNWRSATVEETVARALRPFMDGRENRIRFCGPDAELPPNKALLISMLLHELGTNAVKYGALSNLAGTVRLDWSLKSADDCLRFSWAEAGGPAVAPPTRKGFGSKLIERALKTERGSAEMRFEPSGLVCVMDVPLD